MRIPSLQSSFFFASIVSLSLAVAATSANAQPSHGLSMHGEPAVPAGFTHLPYANPDAPKGGEIVYGVRGTFDSLNPFIVKSATTSARGIWDSAYGHTVLESLLFRSRDEGFTLYGLLAETVETDEDRTFIEFQLRPEAKFSDGKPVRPEDVIFTMNLLTEKGRPTYARRMDKVAKLERVEPNGVRFTFNEKADRELPLLMGMIPIFPENATDAETFDQTTLTPPVGSGPYLVSEVKPNERIVYTKRDDYWGKDLAVKQGFDNFDTIRIEYFRDQNSLFEAFKKGIFDIYPEGNPTKWATNYNFPAVNDGRVNQVVFEPDRPLPMLGIVFNQRREMFQNKNVRKALADVLDFEALNKNLYSGIYSRAASFWQNSELSALGVPASDAEKALLEPFMDEMDPAVMDGTYKPRVHDGSGLDRTVLRDVLQALQAEGYQLRDRKLIGPDGQQMKFAMLMVSADQERIALAYQKSLARLGIELELQTVDSAQFQKRRTGFDYDVVMASFSASLSPGAEQVWRWSTKAADIEGTFAFAGVKSPAVDAMIDALLAARTREEFVTAVRAYDRALISQFALVPLYNLPGERVAVWNKLAWPETTPLYGYRTPTWWLRSE
ncbi:MAG: extracellular solute-binding protein [Pseudomonadota bacterium]